MLFAGSACLSEDTLEIQLARGYHSRWSCLPLVAILSFRFRGHTLSVAEQISPTDDSEGSPGLYDEATRVIKACHLTSCAKKGIHERAHEACHMRREAGEGQIEI